jgi:hypothetical protein
MSWTPYNPYTNQMILYVLNAQKGAVGDFMRDFGDDLEGFAGGEDIEMVGVSVTGQGPPLGWIFASYVTYEQGEAFKNHAELPATVETDHWPVDMYDATTWLATHQPPLIIIDDDE